MMILGAPGKLVGEELALEQRREANEPQRLARPGTKKDREGCETRGSESGGAILTVAVESKGPSREVPAVIGVGAPRIA